MSWLKHFLSTVMAGILAASGPFALAQGSGEAVAYSVSQIEQMVSPIALYPDSLMTQILMASTFPNDIMEANAFVQSRPGLTGVALDNELAMQSWDPSVISLCKFPTVLGRLAQDQQWTVDLGNAFYYQQADVLAAVQRLRDYAYRSGNLVTTTQQRVIVEGPVYQIVPVSPTVIYVPVYNPTVVYGSSWGYPSVYYPTVMAPPPGYVAGAATISFGVGLMVGAMMFGGCDWHHNNVYVNNNVFVQNNIYHNTNVYRNVNVNGNKSGGYGNQSSWKRPEQYKPMAKGPKPMPQGGGQAVRPPANPPPPGVRPGGSQVPGAKPNQGGQQGHPQNTRPAQTQPPSQMGKPNSGQAAIGGGGDPRREHSQSGQPPQKLQGVNPGAASRESSSIIGDTGKPAKNPGTTATRPSQPTGMGQPQAKPQSRPQTVNPSGPKPGQTRPQTAPAQASPKPQAGKTGAQAGQPAQQQGQAKKKQGEKKQPN